MWHVGIDLHRATVVLAAVNDTGEAMNPITIPCSDTAAIVERREGVGIVSRGDRSHGNLSLAVRPAASSRHGSLGSSDATAGHDTTPHQDRQARRPIVGQSPANQPDSPGLHPAGTLPAVARLDALPRQARQTVGRSQDSVAGLAGAAESGIALPDAFRPSRFGLVSRPRLRADRETWSVTNCWNGFGIMQNK